MNDLDVIHNIFKQTFFSSAYKQTLKSYKLKIGNRKMNSEESTKYLKIVSQHSIAQALFHTSLDTSPHKLAQRIRINKFQLNLYFKQTSDFSILSCSKYLVTTSFMFVSNTMPPITISARIL